MRLVIFRAQPRSVKRPAGSVKLVPPIGYVRLAQIVVIPTLTITALEATVLNSFLFRQTNQVPGEAIWGLTTPLDFNQQHLTWKEKFAPDTGVPERMSVSFDRQRPLAADEFQMQAGNAVGTYTTGPHGGDCPDVVMLAGDFHETTRFYVK